MALVVVLVLKPGKSGEPAGSAEVQSAARQTSDLELRNEAFDVVRMLLEDFPRSADLVVIPGPGASEAGTEPQYLHAGS